LRVASRLAILHRAEVVAVAEAAGVVELLALLARLIEEETFVLAGAGARDLRQIADVYVLAAGVLALLLRFEAVPVALASAVVEAVAGPVSLVVVPLRDEAIARSSILWRLTQLRIGAVPYRSSGSARCPRNLLGHHLLDFPQRGVGWNLRLPRLHGAERGWAHSGRRASKAECLAVLLSVESVSVPAAAGVLEELANPGSHLIVPALEVPFASANVQSEIARLA